MTRLHITIIGLSLAAVMLGGCVTGWQKQPTSSPVPSPTVAPTTGDATVDTTLQELDQTAQQQEATGFEGQVLIDGELGL